MRRSHPCHTSRLVSSRPAIRTRRHSRPTGWTAGRLDGWTAGRLRRGSRAARIRQPPSHRHNPRTDRVRHPRADTRPGVPQRRRQQSTGYDQIGFASLHLGYEPDLPAWSAGIVIPGDDNTTAQTITVKSESVGRDGVDSTVSFAPDDEGGVARFTLNGVRKNLTDNPYSDLNGVYPGAFGAAAASKRAESLGCGG
jgi:hypothetical protein